jgi:hypothetical protein
MMRTISTLAAATAILLAPASAPAQRYRESGTIRLETTEVALGIGVQWGHGTLHDVEGVRLALAAGGLTIEFEGAAKPPGD